MGVFCCASVPTKIKEGNSQVATPWGNYLDAKPEKIRVEDYSCLFITADVSQNVLKCISTTVFGVDTTVQYSDCRLQNLGK